MPLYEYKCSKCDKIIDKFYVSYKERKNKIECPDCGSLAIYKLSNTSFILKGNGWANTGYSKDCKSSK